MPCIPRYFLQTIKIFWIIFQNCDVRWWPSTYQWLKVEHFVWQCQIHRLINLVYRNPSKQVSGLRRIPSQIATKCYSQHYFTLHSLFSSSCKIYLSQSLNVFAPISKRICHNCWMYLSKLTNVFANCHPVLITLHSLCSFSWKYICPKCIIPNC